MINPGPDAEFINCEIKRADKCSTVAGFMCGKHLLNILLLL